MGIQPRQRRQPPHRPRLGLRHERPEEATSREQALRALTVDQIPPCVYCTPDRDLGVLE
ncbi:DUF6233 domain-containing protein [Streptomyces niveus]|uniref:DUF6233 domain-containing protein n=1 Tax=Streptomyces niveus TaxID=193462 RepID=UPI00365712BC